MNGAVIQDLWAEGQREKVLEYVANDACVTLQLATMCEEKGCLCWATRTGESKRCHAPWLAFRPRCSETAEATERLDAPGVVAGEMDCLDGAELSCQVHPFNRQIVKFRTPTKATQPKYGSIKTPVP